MQTHEGQRSNGGGRDPLATALGVFSVGLGLAEVAAPQVVARLIGVRENTRRSQAMLRGFGVRELAAGIGILGSTKPGPWLWSRVAGDLMDLAFLGTRYQEPFVERRRLTAATAAVAAVTALDVLASRRRTSTNGAAATSPTREGFITINRSPADVYAFWRKLENLPRFMRHLASVQETGPRTSHWVIEAGGTTVEWDAEIVDDVPGSRLSWRAIEHADVPNEGTVVFAPAPGNRGTEVHVTMTYEPPAGALGATVAKALGHDPEQLLPGELRRLKQLLETGEMPTTAGQPHGKRSLLGKALEPLELGSQS